MLINLPSLANFVKNEVGQNAVVICKNITDKLMGGKPMSYSKLTERLSDELNRLGYTNIANSVSDWRTILENEAFGLPNGTHHIAWS